MCSGNRLAGPVAAIRRHLAANEIDSAELAAFENTRTGVVVSEDILDKYDRQTGDEILPEADI